MAVNNSNGNHTLSSASNALTLSTIGISNLAVTDVNNYGDGRDLKVSFTHAADETNINQYRIMVVPAATNSSLSISDANRIPGSSYTAVSTTGSATSQILTSSTRDVRGNVLKNGTGYYVYVLSAGSGGNTDRNVLSAPSPVITLVNDSNVSAVSNVNVSDVNDYGDGRDLKVSFTHAADETYISQYRIMVVPASYYGNFSLSEADNVPGSNYTAVSTSGNSTTQVLDSSARDVRGALLKEGISYKVYVLSAGNRSQSGPNALSWESSAITLTSAAPVASVTNVTYSVDEGKIRVSFVQSSNESRISEYRVFVVPAKQGFGLGDALGVNASYYKSAYPNRMNPVIMASNLDVNGNPIVKGTKYKVYVLAVANNNGSQKGGLSESTDEFEL